MASDGSSGKGSKLGTWALLTAVFAFAAMVTVYVVNRDSTGGTTATTYSDLGDIVEQDPNLPQTAQPAPRFAVTTLDGGTFDLAEHIADDGRPVILNLWASWCPPCRAEMPEINIAAANHPEIEFVGVAIKDNAADASAFVQEIGADYTLAVDDGTVDKAYPVQGLPATFFIAGNGTLLQVKAGPVTVDSLDDYISQLFGS